MPRRARSLSAGAATRRRRRARCRRARSTSVPDDGLTTRQRRNRPLVVVHTGEMKGKSTAAFGLALRGWSQGWSIGVFQFVKSAKWKVGEEAGVPRARPGARARPARAGPSSGTRWARAGPGPASRAREDDHAAAAAEGWAEIRRRLEAQAHDLYVLDEFTYPISGAGSTSTRWSRCSPPGRAAST